MSAVMMDNWSLENAFICGTSTRNDTDLETPWQTLLMAILLWDEIWYYKSDMSSFWEHIAEHFNHSYLENILYPIDKTLIGDPLTSYEEELTPTGYHVEYSTLAQRTVFYAILSSCLGIDLLVHPNRKPDLSSTQNIFSRLDIWKSVDKEVEEHYRQINSLLEKEMFTFSHPLLYDYIRRNATNREDELCAAVMLRENKDVIEFKSMLTEIENSINSGNTQTFLLLMKTIKEAATEVTNKYCKATTIGELELNITPPFSFGAALTKAIPIKIRRYDPLKIHTTFIKSVITYGVNERLEAEKKRYSTVQLDNYMRTQHFKYP